MRSIKELEKLFRSQDWQEARELYHEGVIESLHYDPDERMLSGSVANERGNGHFQVFIDWGLSQPVCDCNCPQGKFCRHGAILVHGALDDTNPLLESRDEQVAAWLDRLKPQSYKAVKPNQDILIYLLSLAKVRDSHGFKVDIRLTKRLKSGQLSKSLRNSYLSESLLAEVDANERHLLADLMASRNEYGLVPNLDDLAAILATGRCYWQEMGNSPVTLAPPQSGKLSWHQQGGAFHLTLNVPGLSAKDLIASHPLCYLDNSTKTIVPLDFQLTPEQVMALLDAPPLSEAQLAWAWPMMQEWLGNSPALTPPPVELPSKTTAPVPVLELSCTDRKPASCMATLWFDYQGQRISPYLADAILQDSHGQPLPRNKPVEQQAIDILRSAGFSLAPASFNYWSVPDFQLCAESDSWFGILHQLLPSLRKSGWQVHCPADFPYSLSHADSQIETRIEEEDANFFSLSMMIQVGDKPLPLLPILRTALQQLSAEHLHNEFQDAGLYLYIPLSDTQALPLPMEQVRPILTQFVELFMPGSLRADGSIRLSKFQSHQTLAMLNQHSLLGQGRSRLRDIAASLSRFDEIQRVDPPPQLAATLRPYQLQGLSWMQFLREYGLAGILADDMGLGKTLQTIANLCVEKQAGRLTNPALILAPTSVIFNWQNELKRFAPHLQVSLLHGPQRQQQLEKLGSADVVVTSYPLLARDIQHLQAQHWHYLVMDEAQLLKNPATRLYQAVQALDANYKLCLTGTPMENHIGELWALFNLLLPGLLGSQIQFSKLFRQPIEKHNDPERRQLLAERIRPFLLRRSKDKIASELPAKTEIISKVRIEGKQAELYESVRLTVDDSLREVIASKGLGRSQLEILDAMLKLRQVCCHPQLMSLPTAQKVKQSAKLELLLEMLPELVSEGRRILLFSQFTSMLDIIEQQVQGLGIDYVKLTGATRHRQQVIEQFKQGNAPLFLISLKAGGTGLNLTEADTVIHFDPWWNPAAENQATDRAHRIGQDKPVFVYKLIVEGSIEERIQQLQQQKHRLAQAILSDEMDNLSEGFNAENLQLLLQPLVVADS
ncbi:DEAD/DEAH box helicase [Bowmanella sp. Y26]|uniref:DEAD/DEAH box helicase n=1 Tax=Bowmanella yangjiangensis TaxID=2811230 RepID=UPI001BDBD841|nr:DEAD/DEAH box helicase [Bowmanella yangjiangensis]MBT1064508.1 DEAD/DEAH box helicase [Bowmanella yangjiangensis]